MEIGRCHVQACKIDKSCSERQYFGRRWFGECMASERDSKLHGASISHLLRDEYIILHHYPTYQVRLGLLSLRWTELSSVQLRSDNGLMIELTARFRFSLLFSLSQPRFQSTSAHVYLDNDSCPLSSFVVWNIGCLSLYFTYTQSFVLSTMTLFTILD